MSTSTNTLGDRAPAPRDRILETAYELFASRGVQAVGIDELVSRAGIAKATLYKHFASKDDLVVAFLELRERRWTLAWIEHEVRLRGAGAEEQLLAIFDLFDEWFHRRDFEGCSFINVLLELGSVHPAGRASIAHLANIRSLVARLAEEAGLRDPTPFARAWHILMKGSIIAAAEGDTGAAGPARAMAERLIEAHRP